MQYSREFITDQASTIQSNMDYLEAVVEYRYYNEPVDYRVSMYNSDTGIIKWIIEQRMLSIDTSMNQYDASDEGEEEAIAREAGQSTNGKPPRIDNCIQ